MCPLFAPYPVSPHFPVGMPMTLAKVQGWDVQKVYPGTVVAIFPDSRNYDAVYLVVRIRIGWAPHRDIEMGPIFGMIYQFNSLEVGTGNVPWALKRSGYFFQVPNGL
jgi:hypothetical protein